MMSSPTSRGPAKLVIQGTKCVRVNEPMHLNGAVWDTYQPEHDNDDRIFERDARSGRIIQTKESGR